VDTDPPQLGPIGAILRVVALNGLVRQRLRPLPSTWTWADPLAVTELIEAGTLTPVIDRTFPLADTAAASAMSRPGMRAARS
jgi:NADPH:quinone reductase-like Zn-dependent oxidoreductase